MTNTNIPTELLRTLIAVVDLRSFTRAAQSLGVTQPAVSAQIKRLQGLLGSELLDKSAPGVTLTSAGEVVVNHARRLLSINDQILDLSSPKAAGQPIRIGMMGDFAAPALSRVLASLRASHPDLHFTFRSANVDVLLRALREGEMDIVITHSGTSALSGARHHWTDKMVWVCGPAFELDTAHSIPLIASGDECTFHRTAVSALNRVGIRSDLVFVGPTIAALCAAVSAGLGVMVLPGSRIDLPGLAVCDDERLPPLPDVFYGVHCRDGGGREIRDRIAQLVAEALSPWPVSQRSAAALKSVGISAA